MAHRGNSHAENVVYRLSGMYEFVVNNAPNRQRTPGLQSLFLRESVRR
ncbi:hypothetical protein EWT52_26995 [Escherichia coli O25b:H4]|nr:hypothetical protein EWT52_26995 [Escherichia coli O25b:H4]